MTVKEQLEGFNSGLTVLQGEKNPKHKKPNPQQKTSKTPHHKITRTGALRILLLILSSNVIDKASTNCGAIKKVTKIDMLF